MSDLHLIGDLSKELSVDKKTLTKWARNNNCLLDATNRKSGMGGGQHTFAVGAEDADKLRKVYQTNYPSLIGAEVSEVINGVFYFVQTVPDLDTNRIKVGFTENIERRLSEFRTTLPTLKLIKTWKCLRSWETAAIASVARKNCKFLGREVIQCEDYNITLNNCDNFFSIMPSV